MQKYGDWFTYDKNPRAQIFRRNQTQVRDVDSMVRLMRWVLAPGIFQPLCQIFTAVVVLPPAPGLSLLPGRSNNYLQDPLSQCRGCDPPHNAENAISARSDLNPANGTYPFAALRQRCHGGTDTKVGTAPGPAMLSLPGTHISTLPPPPGHLLWHGPHLRAGGCQRADMG